MKKYEKIYQSIIKQIKLREYNNWFARKEWGNLTRENLFLIYTGIRLIDKVRDEKYPNERLPKITKKETEYYENLSNPT